MRNRAAVLTLVLPSLFGVSCVLHGPGDVKRELSQAAGVELDREIGLTLGRTSMWLARTAVKWSDEDDLPSLRGVRKVQVGVYEVSGLRPGYENRRPLSMDLFSDAWQPLVRIHDPGEDVFVLTQQDEQHIRGMLVVVAEQDEWVIVRVKGKLDYVIEDAMRLAFSEMERPELYTATRRERGLDEGQQASTSTAQPQDPVCEASLASRDIF